jgi:hypothetical protein
MGHIYIIAIVTAVQIISFKEVIAIANVPSRARRLRFTKSLNWYWLATTMYFLYGESVIYYFKHIVLVDKVLLPFATHHRFISFMLYVIGNYEVSCIIFLLTAGRFRLLRCVFTSRSLQIPVHTICMDPYGSLLDRGPSTLHHEQRLRGNDMVLPTCFSGDYQRYICIHLWYYIWKDTAYQAISQKDR